MKIACASKMFWLRLKNYSTMPLFNPPNAWWNTWKSSEKTLNMHAPLAKKEISYLMPFKNELKRNLDCLQKLVIKYLYLSSTGQISKRSTI